MRHLASQRGDWRSSACTSKRWKIRLTSTSWAQSSSLLPPQIEYSTRDYPIIFSSSSVWNILRIARCRVLIFASKFMSYENVFRYVSPKTPWCCERINKSMLNETQKGLRLMRDYCAAWVRGRCWCSRGAQQSFDFKITSHEIIIAVRTDWLLFLFHKP